MTAYSTGDMIDTKSSCTSVGQNGSFTFALGQFVCERDSRDWRWMHASSWMCMCDGKTLGSHCRHLLVIGCIHMYATLFLCSLKCEHLGTELVLTGEVWCLQSHGKEIMAKRNQQTCTSSMIEKCQESVVSSVLCSGMCGRSWQMALEWRVVSRCGGAVATSTLASSWLEQRWRSDWDMWCALTNYAAAPLFSSASRHVNKTILFTG